MITKTLDYFMRRKKLLLLVLAAFFLSGYGVIRALQDIIVESDTAYIQNESWSTPEEIEIPKTGNDTLGVISPKVVAEMVWPNDAEDDVLSDEDMNIYNNIVQDTNQETLYIAPEVINTVHQLTFVEILGELTLFALGIGIIILSGYLTYQHFMR